MFQNILLYFVLYRQNAMFILDLPCLARWQIYWNVISFAIEMMYA